MRRRKSVSAWALIGALAFGFSCLGLGAWKALVERGRGEYEIENLPTDWQSYIWVVVAAGILALAVVLTWRRVRRR